MKTVVTIINIIMNIMFCYFYVFTFEVIERACQVGTRQLPYRWGVVSELTLLWLWSVTKYPWNEYEDSKLTIIMAEGIKKNVRVKFGVLKYWWVTQISVSVHVNNRSYNIKWMWYCTLGWWVGKKTTANNPLWELTLHSCVDLEIHQFLRRLPTGPRLVPIRK